MHKLHGNSKSGRLKSLRLELEARPPLFTENRRRVLLGNSEDEITLLGMHWPRFKGYSSASVVYAIGEGSATWRRKGAKRFSSVQVTVPAFPSWTYYIRSRRRAPAALFRSSS